jgi:ubiquinone/menaquinone biosynthesis C-methylase UbiE
LLNNRFPSLAEGKNLRQKFYQFAANEFGKANLYFMNYGYKYSDPPSEPIVLNSSEEPVRFQYQFYHYVATRAKVEGRNVLEVGCGGGAGAYYVARHLKPKSYTGLDFSIEAVRSCRRNQSYAGLTFAAGDAEALPFHDESFDAVINVESSHCYISLGYFLDHVRRVLVPGGHFVLVDFRGVHNLDILQRAIANSGLTVLEDQDITKNVLGAMRAQEQGKEEYLAAAPEHLKTPLREFFGARDSEIFNGFTRGTAVYVSYVLQKT